MKTQQGSEILKQIQGYVMVGMPNEVGWLEEHGYKSDEFVVGSQVLYSKEHLEEILDGKILVDETELRERMKWAEHLRDNDDKDHPQDLAFQLGRIWNIKEILGEKK